MPYLNLREVQCPDGELEIDATPKISVAVSSHGSCDVLLDLFNIHFYSYKDALEMARQIYLKVNALPESADS